MRLGGLAPRPVNSVWALLMMRVVVGAVIVSETVVLLTVLLVQYDVDTAKLKEALEYSVPCVKARMPLRS